MRVKLNENGLEFLDVTPEELAKFLELIYKMDSEISKQIFYGYDLGKIYGDGAVVFKNGKIIGWL